MWWCEVGGEGHEDLRGDGEGADEEADGFEDDEGFGYCECDGECAGDEDEEEEEWSTSDEVSEWR